MFVKNVDKFRISPYMKEYLTRSTNNSVNRFIEYHNSNDYLAEKYIMDGFDHPKKPNYFGLFLFIATTTTFYLLSHKKHDNCK